MTRYRCDDTQTQTPSRYAKVDWGRGRATGWATHVPTPVQATTLHGHHTYAERAAITHARAHLAAQGRNDKET